MSAKVVYVYEAGVLLVGGAFTTIVSPPFAEAMKEFTQEELVVGQPVIVLHKDLKNILSDGEIAAVISHEQGHISLGHLGIWEAQGLKGMSTDNSFELEADKYAAEHTSAADMLSGLVKVIAYAVKNAPLAIIELTWETVMATGRLQALRAMAA